MFVRIHRVSRRVYHAPSTNEHPDRVRCGLQCSTDEHDSGAHDDRMPATNTVGQVWGEREGSDTPDVLEVDAFSEASQSWRYSRKVINRTHLDSVQETKQPTLGAVEVVLPSVHGLQAVDEAPVEAVVR